MGSECVSGLGGGGTGDAGSEQGGGRGGGGEAGDGAPAGAVGDWFSWVRWIVGRANWRIR
ncbi:hypothetical protein [Rhodococcus oryzae]|uniref:hypothetical protein n=1 Tax=Rhodococcus oryzae TaxID=2571143 RepID=UPI0037B5744B